MSKDLISRQAAISAICNACGKIDCDKMDKCEKLQLPPANCSEFPNNSDTISRQAAIDAVMECGKKIPTYAIRVKKAIEELPPAQPSFPQRHENDHIAEVSKMDCISRKAAIDTLNAGAEFLRRVLDETNIVGAERAKYEWGLGLIESYISDMKELPSAQPEQRWITSGKPMNSGMYLVTLRQKFEGEEAYGVRIMRFINGNWVLPKHFPEWINEEIEQEVLAWQDLPEPYKAESEEG